MRILFLSQWFPFPPNNGSKLRIYNLLRGLSERHEITLLSFTDQPEVDPDMPELRALCQEVHILPWKSFEPQSWRARLGFLNIIPRSIVDTFSPEMVLLIEQILSTKDFELVIVSELNALSYGRYLRGLPALIEDPELGVLYERYAHASTVWQRFRHGLTWFKLRHYLARQIRFFSAGTVVSDREKELLSQAIPNFKAIEVIPNCINQAEYRGIRQTPKPNTLIFTGSFRYQANYDAMVWFLREIFPLVQAQASAITLTITGDHANMPLPPANNVTLTGFVDDIRPRIASAWVSLVPLRLGGGTRLKILEAMALGTPVVTTSKGVEGLDARHDIHLLVADTPQAFAEAILRLLKEPGLRQHLAGQAHQLVREKYDWAVVMPRFLNLAEKLAQA